MEEKPNPLIEKWRSGVQPNPGTSQPRPAAQPARPVAPTEDEELKQLERPPEKDPRTGMPVYEAYRPATTRRVEHLEIRLATADWPMPRYFDLSLIDVNQNLGTEIVLQFPLFAVFIAGRNLQPVIFALKWHRCHMLQEYHPEKFAPVEDEQAAFIESIRVVQKGQKPEEESPA